MWDKADKSWMIFTNSIDGILVPGPADGRAGWQGWVLSIFEEKKIRVRRTIPVGAAPAPRAWV